MDGNDWISLAKRHDPWDAVVLGAGPAGAISARHLARQGLRVLLVEKSRLPRFKACGGCLGGAALDVLREVGLSDLPSQCGGVALNSMLLANDRSRARIVIGRRIALSRTTLDSAITQAAVESGAQLCTETVGSLALPEDVETRTVVLRHWDQAVAVRAKVVLVATGLSRSPPGHPAQASPDSRIGLGALLESSSQYAEPGTLYMACGAQGYVGIAPVEGGLLDCAAAVDHRALSAAGSPGNLVARILRDAGLPPLTGIESANWRGTPMLSRRASSVASHRCLLLGDAAGYVEPFTGEGIGWAMRSAVMACSILTEGLVWDARLPDRWRELYEQTFRRHQQRCRLITQLLRYKMIRNVALWSLRQAPKLARPIVRTLDH